MGDGTTEIVQEKVEKMPKVSVCVITYNQEKYIRQCLQSIVDQETNFDFEVIIGEDCSTDGTKAIVKEFAAKYPDVIRVIFQKENTGGGGNFIGVHNAALGEYIAHVDGDDYWRMDKLKVQTDFLDTNDDCVAVYSNAIIVSKNDEFMGYFNRKVRSKIDINFLLEEGNFLNFSSLMYRNSVKKNIFPAAVIIDYFINLSLAKEGYLGYCNETLTTYRIGETGSISSTNSTTVERLVWSAIETINDKNIKAKSLNSASAAFLLGVIIPSLKKADIRYILYWLNIVLSSKKSNSVLVMALLCHKVLRYLWNRINYSINVSIFKKKRHKYISIR